MVAAATDGGWLYCPFPESGDHFGEISRPLADKLLILATMICLLSLGKIGAVAIIIILTRELMVTGLRAIAADKGIVIAASILAN